MMWRRAIPPVRGLTWPFAPVLLLALVFCVGGACSHAPVPVAGVPVVGKPTLPVVLVPGLTGSKLRSRESGETVWIDGPGLLFPRDGGYGIALPISGPPDGRKRLEAFGILETIRLGPVRRGIYGPLLSYLEAQGYRRGRLDPASDSVERRIDPDASLYTFAYDWRESAVGAAAELAEALDELRRARGTERLRVDLICQSSGGYVCRWLAKYGSASLEEAGALLGAELETGSRSNGAPSVPGLDRIEIRRMILVGSANGGALRTLRELHRGRRYLKPIGRRMRPEVLFTFPALYEDLPHRIGGGDPAIDREGSVFIDRRGEPIEPAMVDLYDPETWKRLGWSVFDPDTARRIEASGRPDLFGTAAERQAFLARSLHGARRFQELLARDPAGFVGGRRPRYYLVGNTYAETPRRAVLMDAASAAGRGARRLLFTGDPELARRPYLAARATGPGDGHATVASMHHLSPAEREAVAAEPFYISGGHFEMIVEPATHRRILELLSGDP